MDGFVSLEEVSGVGIYTERFPLVFNVKALLSRAIMKCFKLHSPRGHTD